MMKKKFAQSEAVKTGDGSFSLQHPDHGELFHSFSGAALEAKDLYIKSSSINECWNSGQTARVLDVGLGLGYNALTTLAEFLKRKSPAARLEITSLELEVELVELLSSGESAWQQGWPEAWLELCRKLTKTSEGRIETEGYGWHWDVICGDALKVDLAGKYDFIWQDPFSPEKNPPMWSSEWFAKVREASHSKTELLSYSVSRTVKDALVEGGWQFERIDTTTTKRHWLRAKLA